MMRTPENYRNPLDELVALQQQNTVSQPSEMCIPSLPAFRTNPYRNTPDSGIQPGQWASSSSSSSPYQGYPPPHPSQVPVTTHAHLPITQTDSASLPLPVISARHGSPPKASDVHLADSHLSLLHGSELHLERTSPPGMEHRGDLLPPPPPLPPHHESALERLSSALPLEQSRPLLPPRYQSLTEMHLSESARYSDSRILTDVRSAFHANPYSYPVSSSNLSILGESRALTTLPMVSHSNYPIVSHPDLLASAVTTSSALPSGSYLGSSPALLASSFLHLPPAPQYQANMYIQSSEPLRTTAQDFRQMERAAIMSSAGRTSLHPPLPPPPPHPQAMQHKNPDSSVLGETNKDNMMRRDHPPPPHHDSDVWRPY